MHPSTDSEKFDGVALIFLVIVNAVLSLFTIIPYFGIPLGFLITILIGYWNGGIRFHWFMRILGILAAFGVFFFLACIRKDRIPSLDVRMVSILFWGVCYFLGHAWGANSFEGKSSEEEEVQSVHGD